MPLTLIAVTGSMDGCQTIRNYLTQTYGFNEYVFSNPQDVGLSMEFEKHQLGESNPNRIRLFEHYIENVTKDLPNGCIVVSDVKFINEDAVIKKYGGYIIKIDRPSDVSTADLYKNSSETEQNQIKPDFTIEDTGTIDDMYKKISYITDYIIHNI